MVFDLKFEPQILDSCISGTSSVDVPRLDVQDLTQAQEFVKTYGYDLLKPDDLHEVWELHRKAISFIKDRLLDPGELIPEILIDSAKLIDPAYLLVYASTRDHKDNTIQGWSCAILRVMHVMAHLEDDFFKIFQEQVQREIFGPFQAHLRTDPVSGVSLGLKEDREQIRLMRFDMKPSKSLSSATVKLLTKKEVTALNIYDKVGVRFVTKSVFDCFRVVRFLVAEHLISFPNIMPDQSRNTLYPVNIFLEAMAEMTKQNPTASNEEIQSFMAKKLEEGVDRAEYKERKNDFSGQNYRNMKFIARKLIIVESGGNKFRFFYPYEIQIMDYDTYLKNISGPEAHEKYKTRQREAARRRVLGALLKT